MRRLLLVLLIVLFGAVPAVGFAQTPPAKAPAPATLAPAPATVPPPAAAKAAEPQSSIVDDDTRRILTIGLGAIAGTVVLSVISVNFIGANALANLGKGAVVFVGTVTGGLIGSWLYNR